MIDTSLQAYNSILPDLSRKQKAVMGALFLLRGGATNEEISNYLHLPINTITPRTGELMEKGLIARGEKVKGSSGRCAYKYIVQPYQMKLL